MSCIILFLLLVLLLVGVGILVVAHHFAEQTPAVAPKTLLKSPPR